MEILDLLDDEEYEAYCNSDDGAEPMDVVDVAYVQAYMKMHRGCYPQPFNYRIH